MGKLNPTNEFQTFWWRLTHFEHFRLFGEVKPISNISDFFGQINPFRTFQTFLGSLTDFRFLGEDLSILHISDFLRKINPIQTFQTFWRRVTHFKQIDFLGKLNPFQTNQTFWGNPFSNISRLVCNSTPFNHFSRSRGVSSLTHFNTVRLFGKV